MTLSLPIMTPFIVLARSGDHGKAVIVCQTTILFRSGCQFPAPRRRSFISPGGRHDFHWLACHLPLLHLQVRQYLGNIRIHQSTHRCRPFGRSNTRPVNSARTSQRDHYNVILVHFVSARHSRARGRLYHPR